DGFMLDRGRLAIPDEDFLSADPVRLIQMFALADAHGLEIHPLAMRAAGRVVAQMQFDMYHHYTVDEHSIRAIGLLSRIERGLLKDDHPLPTVLFRQIASRRTLYVAVLLHDI